MVPLLFYYMDGFGIKFPKIVDMPLNKESETILPTHWPSGYSVF